MKLVGLAALMLLISGTVFGEEIQGTKGGDIGLVAEIGWVERSLGFEWNVTENFIVIPEIGFDVGLHQINNDSVFTTNFGSWYGGSLAVLFQGSPLHNVYVATGFKVSYFQVSPHKDDGTGNTLSSGVAGLDLIISPKVLFSSNFGVFTAFGLQVYSSTEANETTKYSISQAGVRSSTTALGIVYYFK